MLWCARALCGLTGLVWAQAACSLSPENLAEVLKQCPAKPDHACHALVEAQVLARAPQGQVSRQGPRLSLLHRRGKALVLDDALSDPAHALRHVYLGELGITDLQLVRTVGPAAPQALLLVAESGQPPMAADDVPWPAPGGRLVVVVAPRSVTLWLRTALRWTQAFRYEPPAGVRLSFKGWRGDGGAVRMDWQWQRGGSPCTPIGATAGQVQLRDGPYGWEITPELPLRCP
ncbi:hypothetical protein [Ideonella paludis]|uniref:Uncharacterized protein n=1 Tax=Ideonella paludis TaxID=1233411 RepID=A0ABS5DW76_9BURK|nr:hypothetical protein [Ideonella paludis]MBQ0935403.1 hypothetical protein [Ideonella paludis]